MPSESKPIRKALVCLLSAQYLCGKRAPRTTPHTCRPEHSLRHRRAGFWPQGSKYDFSRKSTCSAVGEGVFIRGKRKPPLPVPGVQRQRSDGAKGAAASPAPAPAPTPSFGGLTRERRASPPLSAATARRGSPRALGPVARWRAVPPQPPRVSLASPVPPAPLPRTPRGWPRSLLPSAPRGGRGGLAGGREGPGDSARPGGGGAGRQQGGSAGPGGVTRGQCGAGAGCTARRVRAAPRTR